MDNIDTIETGYAISPQDVLALRVAHRICFRHARGESSIEAVKEPRDPKAAFAAEQRHVIPCGWQLTDYSRDDGRIPGYGEVQARAFTAFEFLSAAHFHEEWTTLAALVRAGDRLTLHWKRNGFQTQALEEGDFHGDALVLVIERGGKRLSFLVDTCACQDNSARMIKRA